jgi:thiosulfate sulfurtransferase
VSEVPTISLEDAQAQFTEKSALFVDIRDARSIAEAHIPESKTLNNGNALQFVTETAKDQPIVVYCYHGNNSKMVTTYLLEQGFEDVKSMNGGFEDWRLKFETASS